MGARGLRTTAGRKLAALAPLTLRPEKTGTKPIYITKMEPKGQVHHDMSGTKTYVVIHLPPRRLHGPSTLMGISARRLYKLPILSPAPNHQGRSLQVILIGSQDCKRVVHH